MDAVYCISEGGLGFRESVSGFPIESKLFKNFQAKGWILCFQAALDFGS